MSFRDLDEFLDATLQLPIRGKTYVVPSPDAKTGLWCQRVLAAAAKAKAGGEINATDTARLKLDDDEERDLFQRLLGPAWDEMLADGVPWEYVKHVGVTALMWAAGSREKAEEYWASGGKAPRPTPQDRKAPAKKTAAKKSAAPRASSGGSTTPKKAPAATPGTTS